MWRRTTGGPQPPRRAAPASLPPPEGEGAAPPPRRLPQEVGVREDGEEHWWQGDMPVPWPAGTMWGRTQQLVWPLRTVHGTNGHAPSVPSPPGWNGAGELSEMFARALDLHAGPGESRAPFQPPRRVKSSAAEAAAVTLDGLRKALAKQCQLLCNQTLLAGLADGGARVRRRVAELQAEIVQAEVVLAGLAAPRRAPEDAIVYSALDATSPSGWGGGPGQSPGPTLEEGPLVPNTQTEGAWPRAGRGGISDPSASLLLGPSKRCEARPDAARAGHEIVETNQARHGPLETQDESVRGRALGAGPYVGAQAPDSCLDAPGQPSGQERPGADRQEHAGQTADPRPRPLRELKQDLFRAARQLERMDPGPGAQQAGHEARGSCMRVGRAAERSGANPGAPAWLVGSCKRRPLDAVQ